MLSFATGLPFTADPCPSGDHLRLVDVHLVMDIVPADGNADADIEMFAYGDYRVTLPPVLQSAAEAHARFPDPVGRVGIFRLLTRPAPLHGFTLSLLTERSSEAFLTFTPDP